MAEVACRVCGSTEQALDATGQCTERLGCFVRFSQLPVNAAKIAGAKIERGEPHE